MAYIFRIGASNSTSKIRFRLPIRIPFAIEFEASLPSYYSCSNLNSKIDSNLKLGFRILIQVRIAFESLVWVTEIGKPNFEFVFVGNEG